MVRCEEEECQDEVDGDARQEGDAKLCHLLGLQKFHWQARPSMRPAGQPEARGGLARDWIGGIRERLALVTK